MEQQDLPKKPDFSPASDNFIWVIDVVARLIVFVFVSIFSYSIYFEHGLFVSILVFIFGLILGAFVFHLRELDRRDGYGFRRD